MARPSLLRGSYVTLYRGNGAGPEVFEPVCGLISKSMSSQVNTSDNFVRDCDDPSAIPVRNVTATGRQWDVTGQGLMAREVYERLKNSAGRVGNWRYTIENPGDDVMAGYWAGRAMLTQLQIVGADGNDVAIDITLASTGLWTWVDLLAEPPEFTFSPYLLLLLHDDY